MPEQKTLGKLSATQKKAFGSALETKDVEKRNDPEARPQIVKKYLERHELLKDISIKDIRHAWFTMSHLMLEPGAEVLDMGCGDGAKTYAMAALHPDLKFTGVDIDKKAITKAKKDFSLPNLEFKVGDIRTDAGFEESSVDCIINSFVLHKIYSGSRYNERSVVKALETQFSLLKENGRMFVRSYSMPPPGEYVMIEMPDVPRAGEDIESLSEADLLVWYAENARPVHGQGCNGFFLEELPERFPQTRLFRLPYKWAYEFITRKDNRAEMVEELPREYAFFTPREFRKNLRALGARVLYSSPHWDDAEIQEKFNGHFRLYKDDGKPLGLPPTSFVAVAQKMGDKQSLHLHERRTTQKAQSKLSIKAMRNDITGKIFDIVSRDVDITEILPYRITGDGSINVFVHEGVPRAITNAVPRNGKEIDGKRWSGHMTEAIAVPTDAVLDIDPESPKDTVLFARDYLGLMPTMDSKLQDGPSFFPAPDFIDEHIKTRYLQVRETNGPTEPKKVVEDLQGFTTTGKVREISAQSLLNAINVGFIPNSRLESQLEFLFDMLGEKAETWEDSPLILPIEEPEEKFDTTNFAKTLVEGDKRFKDVKGTAGQLRTIQSIFIDEGWSDGGVTGLTSKDMEFVVTDEQTVNKAVVIPLTKDLKGKVMAGMCTEFLPIPQRFEGTGMTVRAPCFPLPKEVTTIEEAKAFIAEQFGVKPDKVTRLGESFFNHIGITPQRIFPFAVASGKSVNAPIGGPVQFAPMDYMWSVIGKVLDWSGDEVFIAGIKKAYRRLGYDSDLNLKNALGRENLYGRKAPDMSTYTDMSGTKATVKSEAPAASEPASSETRYTDDVTLKAKEDKSQPVEEGKKFHLK